MCPNMIIQRPGSALGPIVQVFWVELEVACLTAMERMRWDGAQRDGMDMWVVYNGYIHI